MLIAILLVAAASVWLLWEWRTGALAGERPEQFGPAPLSTAVRKEEPLPTAAARRADAVVPLRAHALAERRRQLAA